jgi:hypothetical protein
LSNVNTHTTFLLDEGHEEYRHLGGTPHCLALARSMHGGFGVAATGRHFAGVSLALPVSP